MIGNYRWNKKFKKISKKYNIKDLTCKLNKQINKLDKLQEIFFLSALIVHLEFKKNIDFNINIDDMIFLKPNYDFLLHNDKLDDCNIDYKFTLNASSKKINLFVNNITIKTNNFRNIEEEFLILVRDKTPTDNLIMIIPTMNMKGGQYVYSNNSINTPSMQAGIGYDSKLHTSQGYDIGQYKAPLIDIDKAPKDLQEHDSNQHPSDPLFGKKKLEGLIMDKKRRSTNFQKGFEYGFDNGYNKGYYFGYSSAAAYLYRYYKMFYKKYMEKYRQKLIRKQRKEMYDYIDKTEADKYKSNLVGGFFFNTDKMKKNLIESQLSRLTGSNLKLDPEFSDDKLNEFDDTYMYMGLPDYMMPENTFKLGALKPDTIFDSISYFFFPPKASEDPKLHCKKPTQKDLNYIFSLNFHPKFRDAIVSADTNWNEKIFRKSCNRYNLMLRKYCPTDNHPGVEYDPNIGAFYKACKRKKDEAKFCILS